MRINIAILIAFLLGINACSSNDAAFTLPGNIYTITNAYDVGNTGNASDVRIEFDFVPTTNTADLQEVRLVIVKATSTFTTAQIETLPSGNYAPIPISGKSHDAIKATASLKDAEGNPITNGNYKVYIAIIGIKKSLQLSEAKNLSLGDSPIYAGDYTGSWEDLGPPGPAKFGMSLRIANDYTGKMFYANTVFRPFGSGAQDALTTLTVDGTTINSFVIDQFIAGHKGGCPATKTIKGHFEDDVNLILDTFQWADCDGTRNVILKFQRQ